MALDDYFFSDPATRAVPDLMADPGQPTQVRMKQKPWNPKSEAATADLSGFQSLDDFFASPQYKAASYFGKKELEAEYKRRFLNKPVTQALGGDRHDLESAQEFFKKNAAVDERKNDSVFDTDVLDIPYSAAVRGLGGVARVASAIASSDGDPDRGATLGRVADALQAHSKSVDANNLSATTRYKRDAERDADAKLAAEYGGKENIPIWQTARQEVSNFMAQPLNKILDAVGSSLPALAPALIGGPVGLAASVGAQAVLTSGDAGSGAYDSIMAMPMRELQKLPAFQAKMAEVGDFDAARKALAQQAALEGGAYGAVIGTISGGISARVGAVALLQKKLAGAPLSAAERRVVAAAEQGVLRRVGVPIAGEAGSEFVEEFGTQVGSNKAVQSINPEQSLTEDAFKAGFAGAMAGGGMAGAVHALPGQSAPNPPAPAGEPRLGPSGDPADPSQPEAPAGTEVPTDTPILTDEAPDGADPLTTAPAAPELAASGASLDPLEEPAAPADPVVAEVQEEVAQSDPVGAAPAAPELAQAGASIDPIAPDPIAPQAVSPQGTLYALSAADYDNTNAVLTAAQEVKAFGQSTARGDSTQFKDFVFNTLANVKHSEGSLNWHSLMDLLRENASRNGVSALDIDLISESIPQQLAPQKVDAAFASGTPTFRPGVFAAMLSANPAMSLDAFDSNVSAVYEDLDQTTLHKNWSSDAYKALLSYQDRGGSNKQTIAKLENIRRFSKNAQAIINAKHTLGLGPALDTSNQSPISGTPQQTPMKPTKVQPLEHNGPPIHPKLDENGNQFAVYNPTPEQSYTQAELDDPSKSITIVPGQKLPGSLAGKPIAGVTGTYDQLRNAAQWNAISGVAAIGGINNDIPPGANVERVGVIITEDDGRVWMVEPSNHYSAETLVLPRGRHEEGYSYKSTAMKEAFEETGLCVRLRSNQEPIQASPGIWFFVAERYYGTPADMGWESQSVKLMPIEQAIEQTSNRSAFAALTGYRNRMEEAKAENEKLLAQQKELAAAQEKTAKQSITAFRSKIYKALGLLGPLKVSGDINAPLSDAARQALSENNIGKALRDIANHADNPTQRLMAARLLDVADKTGLILSGKQPMITVAGSHTPVPSIDQNVDVRKAGEGKLHGVITLSVDYGGMRVHSLLHELAHAFTAYSYSNPKTTGQKLAKQELKNLHALALAEANQRGLLVKNSPLYNTVGKYLRYGLEFNTSEFIAEAYSNPLMQEFLVDISMDSALGKPKSMLAKFAELIGKLIGLDNALARTFLAVEQLVDPNQNVTNATSAFTHAASLNIDTKATFKGIKGDPDHLMVNGIKRARKNADGKLIAKTNREIADFWRWFKNSRAVDSEGRPIVFYRTSGAGTVASALDNHSKNVLEGFGQGKGTKAFYFSSSKKVSKTYSGGMTLEAYLRLTDPWEVDSKGAHYASIKGPGGSTFATDSVMASVQMHGHDGTLVHNNLDASGGGSIPSTIATVFFPEQVRQVHDAANPLHISTKAEYIPSQAVKRNVRGYAADTIGEPTQEGAETGGRNDAGTTDGRGEQDHSGVPDPDPIGSASSRETGTAAGTGNPFAEGPPSNRVAQSVAKLGDAERVAIEVAGGLLNISGADFAQLLHDTAEEVGPEAVLDIFNGDSDSDLAVRQLILPVEVKAKLDTAKRIVSEQVGPISTWDQWTDLMDNGIAPKSNKYAGWTDRYIEKFVDSAQPFARMLRAASVKVLDNPLWRTFKLAGSRYENEKMALNKDVRVLNTALTRLAKSIGMDPQTFFLLADRYTLAKYVATGANEELAARHQDAVRQIDAQITALQAKQTTNPHQFTELERQIEKLQDRQAKSNAWLIRYREVDGEIRKPEGAIDATGAPDPHAKQPTDKFVGGLTRAEAQYTLNSKQVAPNRGAFEEAQQLIVGLQKQWRQRAIDAGLFNQDEVDAWSKNPNYVPTTGDPDAQEQEGEVYGTGGLVSRDFLRMGRNSYADGGFIAVVQQASGFARRVAFRDFNDMLADVGRDPSNPYGIKTVPVGAPSKGLAFAAKRWVDATDTEPGHTAYEKVTFQDQAAAESIVGANRQEVESLALRSMGAFTSVFGRAVTQYTLAFGPVNYLRDLGEKAYTLLSTVQGIDKRRFLSALASELFSINGLKAAWAFSSGKTLSSPEFQSLQQLSDMGGLNTRTGSLSRDVDRIVKEMKRTDGWRQAADTVGEWVHNYNNMFEMAASLAVYRALGKAGNGTIEDNAFQVLNSMNFGQSGAYSPIFKTMYLFFNPTVQGALNVARGVEALKTKDGRTVMMGAALAYGFLYAFSRAFGGDDEEDETGNRVDSLADASLARSIPLFFGDDLMVKVPVPFGLQTALWSTMVAGGRLASGRFSPTEAAGFALQGMAEQMTPFPMSRADISKDPTFWMLKSLTPQIGQVVVNLASNKDDFANTLTNSFASPDKPDSMQGKRGTPQAYKDAAETLYRIMGVDLAPETIRELVKQTGLGPLGAAIDGFVKDEEKSGVSPPLAAAEGLLGTNRIVKSDTREVDRSYYERMERVYALQKKAWSQEPRIKLENGRYEDMEDWLERTELTTEQRELILAFEETDRALKKARRAGSVSADERQIMRDFLRDTKDFIR